MSPGLMPRPSLSALRLDQRRSVAGVPVSPGLMPRPSLSARHERPSPAALARVAGVDAPAFVERIGGAVTSMCGRVVSPGLMPRPSLSVFTPLAQGRSLDRVSPGLMPRPSLSAGRAGSLAQAGRKCRRG